MSKTINYEAALNYVRGVESLSETREQQLDGELAVYHILLNHDTVTDEMLSRITQEQIEMATDTMINCDSSEDIDEEDGDNVDLFYSFRASLYQSVIIRETGSGLWDLKPAPPNTFF